MFPWQSGSYGTEATPRLLFNTRSGRWINDNSGLQRHVDVAIAYNVWQYYQVSADIDFMASFGAELLLEIARFLASITSYDAVLDRYEIRGVVGPDEYHDAYPGSREPGLHNNAYTNVMAAWVPCRALDVIEVLEAPHRERIVDLIGLGRDELARWEEISRKLVIPFHGDGIISQFEGYGTSPSSTGTPTAASTATSSASTSSSRPKGTARTATSSRSRRPS